MTSEMPIRCVVWFGEPSDAERVRLAQAGWHTRVVDPLAPGSGIGIRHGDTVVAMADLRKADDAVLRDMGRLVTEHTHVPWLAMLPADAKHAPLEAQRILAACHCVFTSPLDMRHLRKALDILARVAPTAMVYTDMTGITGTSPTIQSVATSLRKYAPVDLPVLITGETGCGKEIAARALHRLSLRREFPFAAINCGALPANLVQSELFGHERGAFTGANMRRVGHFEAAAGGTVFLDEVGDLPMDAQTSLLRLLQEGTLERVGSTQSIRLDVRVLAATHVDLEKAVEQGRFREDLYYRLNVLRLRMPALRERGDDVLQLAQQFLDEFREHHACRARTFSVMARKAMCEFAWPGNVRELLNRVRRAAVMAEGAQISVDDLELHGAASQYSPKTSLGITRTEAEREAVVACLRESRFNISECARRLKVSRITVYRLCKKHRLDVADLQ